MGMMQVGPNEAEINFCKWVRLASPGAADRCLDVPHLEAITWAIALALILVSIGLFFGLRFFHLRRKPDLISFSEAARLMYELASDKLKADMRGTNKSAEEIEDGCKMMLLIAGNQGIVRLFGRRGDGFVREPIAATELDEMYSNGGDVIGRLPHNVDYIDVAINRGEVRYAVKQFDG